MTTVLSADIGGTKTLIELNQFSDNTLVCIKKHKFISANYVSFDEMLHAFLNLIETKGHAIDVMCLAIAGPVQRMGHNQVANVTNLPWQMNASKIQATFRIPKVHFINDFQAMGHAIDFLDEDDIDVLQRGETISQGVRAVIGAGTGLGEAILVHSASGYDVLATEGGHLDFAPTCDLEIDLYRYLHERHQHVSYERVLSGQGLVSIYDFFIQHEQIIKNDAHKKILTANDPAAEISSAAKEKQQGLSARALMLFMKIYGAKAGNLALTCLPTAGIYITGGIAAKNLTFLKNSQFIHAFNAKGRMQELLEKIPVNIITNMNTGLIGATQYALKSTL